MAVLMIFSFVFFVIFCLTCVSTIESGFAHQGGVGEPVVPEAHRGEEWEVRERGRQGQSYFVSQALKRCR